MQASNRGGNYFLVAQQWKVRLHPWSLDDSNRLIRVARDVLGRLLDVVAERRLSIVETKSHDWIAD